MRKLTEDDIERIKKLRNRGFTHAKLSEIFHVSRMTIMYHLNKNKNKTKNNRRYCLLLIKKYLKRGVISEADLIKIIKSRDQEQIQNKSTH